MIKICAHCGLEFETNNPQKIYCDRIHYLPCPVCGELVAKSDNDFTRPAKCCSLECRKQLRMMHLPERRCVECGKLFRSKSGVNTICDAQHYRNCVICGKSFEVSRRDIHDNRTTCSRECAKEQMRQFYQSKYGVDHPMQNADVQQKFHESMRNKYGVAHALQVRSKVEQQQAAVIKTNTERHGVPFACLLPQCTEANKHANIISKTNQQFGDKLKSIGVEYEFEFGLDRYKYDIALHEQRVLIEIDPTYTHTDIDTSVYGKRDRTYHMCKSEVAAANNYRCIHVFDWDDVEKVVNLIRPKQSIGARKCKLVQLSKQQVDEFLNRYHLQNTCYGQKVKLGLEYDGRIIQVMTFGKPRYSAKQEWELLRLCTAPEYLVIGGAEKLFKYAVDTYDMKSVISYCDASKFTGDVYTRLGMKQIRHTPPQKVWSKSTNKITSALLRQRGYDQLFKTNYGKGTDNEQLMIENGWLSIYDCGQYVFEWVSKEI